MNETARDIAYRRIRALIVGIDARSGAFLKESDLAERFGVSRTPVREALRVLEAEGLLQITPQKGAYIAPIPPSELADIMDVRLALELFAAKAACDRSPLIRGELEALVSEAVSLLDSEELDIQQFIDYDLSFHRTMIGAIGNSVLASIYDSLRTRQVRMAVAILNANPLPRLSETLIEHKVILSCVEKADAEALADAISDHARSTLEAALNPCPIARGQGSLVTAHIEDLRHK